ncbi:hypothetical protein ABZ299_00090 [Streptomyces sp. NPDC006184]|uniref:hypothetical protein n=1 Tax=unclassified Streptomyces TaxID=2593676 RepID=UPI0033B8032F
MLDLYSSSSVELDADEVADAMALADTATLLLLDARISETGVPSDTGASSTSVSGTDRPDAAPFDDLGGHRAEIGQATGVLMVQLGVASTGHSSGCAPTRTPGEHGSRWSPT